MEKFKLWLKTVGIRTLKTMAETAIAVIGTDAFGIADVNWIGLLSAVALSGIVTILMNVKEIEE